MKSIWLKIRLYLFMATILSSCSNVDFTDTGSLYYNRLNLPSGSFHSQVFIQKSTKGKVDLLVVVDNSLSMAAEQQKLGQRIQSFLSYVDGADWQLGVTTTDITDSIYGLKGKLLDIEGTNSKILNKRVPNYEQLFLDTVTRDETNTCVDVCPSGDEQPIRATMMAIDERNGTNAGFFRDDADLGVLILSDEDEHSKGREGAAQAQDLVDHFRSVWGFSKQLFTYGIITEPGDQACLDGEGQNYGNIIEELTQLTQGITGSICDNDYGSTLGSIGENLGNLLNFLELDAVPENGTVELTFAPAAPNAKWTVSGRRITFDTPPPEGTKIVVGFIVE